MPPFVRRPLINLWLFFAGLAILMALVAVGTVRTGQLLRTWTPSYNLMLSLPDNGLRLALLALCAAWGAWVGPGAEALGWRTPYWLSDTALGAVAGVILAGGLALLGKAVERRWGEAVSDTKMLRCILPASSGEWPGTLLALLLAAALEELMFRSLPLGGAAAVGGAGSALPYLLLWPLALFFGALHWPQSGWGVVGTTLAAVALALLFLLTGGIWAPLAAHYVMNVMQLLAARRMGIEPLRGVG